MKRKLWWIALSLCLLVVVAACGASNEAQSTTTSEAPSTAEGESTSENASNDVSVSADASQVSEQSQEANQSQTPTLRVAASTLSLYDFASRIGGDRVSVSSLLPPGADAHSWEPSPQQLVEMMDNNIMLISGVELETWLEPIMSTLPDSVSVVDTSKGIELLKFEDMEKSTILEDGEEAADDHDHEHAADVSEAHDHAQEEAGHADEHHHHGLYDPHYWLSVANAKIQAKNVLDALVSADAAGKEYYQSNYDALAKDLDLLKADYDKALTPYKGRSIVVPHDAFGYLANTYGLTQYGIEGVFAEGEPNTAKMKSIIDYAKAHDVNTIFYEPSVGDTVSQQIASEIGGKVLPLSTLEVRTAEMEANGTGYVESMRKNLESLVSSFQ